MAGQSDAEIDSAMTKKAKVAAAKALLKPKASPKAGHKRKMAEEAQAEHAAAPVTTAAAGSKDSKAGAKVAKVAKAKDKDDGDKNKKKDKEKKEKDKALSHVAVRRLRLLGLELATCTM
ncbi:unnamed protein product [Symbiodinium sp. CCMP2592]|nr:unnamed protein product [Symbiodinium sp. CCMP2592]